MVELHNQEKMYQLREDDERFNHILVAINRMYPNWINMLSLPSELEGDNFFNGDCKHSRKLYDAICVTSDDEDIVLTTVLEDSNIQVHAWSITRLFFRSSNKELGGGIAALATYPLFKRGLSDTRGLVCGNQFENLLAFFVCGNQFENLLALIQAAPSAIPSNILHRFETVQVLFALFALIQAAPSAIPSNILHRFENILHRFETVQVSFALVPAVPSAIPSNILHVNLYLLKGEGDIFPPSQIQSS